MNAPRSCKLAFALISLIGFTAIRVPADIMVMVGNAPRTDPGWPEGSVAEANLETRIGLWEGPPFGGGEWHFSYRGNTEAFRKALELFAAIRAPALDLVLHDGPTEDAMLKLQSNFDAHMDWSFTVWIPASWHHLYSNPKSSLVLADSPNFHQPIAPPRLDVYLGGGNLDWGTIKVPANLHVRNERASAAGTAKPFTPTVRAEAFDMATGKPIAKLHLMVSRMSNGGQNQATDYKLVAQGMGDASGRVLADQIPAGVHRVLITADGYVPRVLDYAEFDEHTFKTFSTELSRSAQIQGRVIDSDAKPIPGVRVQVMGTLGIDGRGYRLTSPPAATTDAEGRFSFSELPTGFVQLNARAPGYFFSESRTLHDTPSTNLVLQLNRAGQLEVSITDHDGKPLSKLGGNPLLVEIRSTVDPSLNSWAGSGEVDVNGKAEYKSIPPGEYRLSSRPNPSSAKFVKPPEQIITIAPGASVAVKIIYPSVSPDTL